VNQFRGLGNARYTLVENALDCKKNIKVEMNQLIIVKAKNIIYLLTDKNRKKMLRLLYVHCIPDEVLLYLLV